jgi:diguanylate cyclase (GGDEF)-like protein
MEFDLGESGEERSELVFLSQRVLDTLLENNIPPTPRSFQLHFDRLFDECETLVQEKINEILVYEDHDDDAQAQLEKQVKKGFFSIKQILELASEVYKNMNLMNKILNKKSRELNDLKENIQIKEFVFDLRKDIDILNDIVTKQVLPMKKLYKYATTITQAVEEKTIFDQTFGMYNKKYLTNKINQESKLLTRYNHFTSLIMLRISNRLMESLKDEKERTLITKILAKLLLKSSRRSDVISHYGDGIFSLILPYMNIQSAQLESERLWNLVANSNFFIDSKEIKIDIKVGISHLNPKISVNDNIHFALEAMKEADKKNTKFAVYKDSSQE